MGNRGKKIRRRLGKKNDDVQCIGEKYIYVRGRNLEVGRKKNWKKYRPGTLDGH